MIDKNTTLADILKNPENKEILAKYNLPCLTCPFASAEMAKLKIGKICKMYGIPLDDLLSDLNEKTGE